MALNIGDLVATIRADDSGWARGLEAARLRMRGLTRDADGQLRDLRGRFVSQGEAAGRGLADGIRAHAERAVGPLKLVGKAVAGVGVGLPAVAAVGAALGSLAAGAVAAGLAVGAFKLAVGPQMEAVQHVADLAAKAEEAAAEGGEKAAAATAAYQDALAKLSPATQATAKSFVGLKSDFKAWSDGLSGTTMPVFTKGIEVLRDLLPMLTPFVRAAALALGDMLDRVAVGVKSAGFKEWAADMATAAGPALTNFTTILGNLGKGVAGLLRAFLPLSAGTTGGLVSMTAAFADWGAGLKDSEGFAKFLDLAQQGGGTLGALATAAVDLVVAASPLLGVTTMLATHLAKIISSTPAPVLKVLVAVLAAVKVGMIAYKIASAGVALANRLMASSTWAAIAGWTRMMAVGLMAYIRIGAAAVVSAATTAGAWVGSALVSIGTWIAAVVRAGITAAAQFLMMAARAVAWAAIMAAQWLIAMGPIGWIIAAVIGLAILIWANWDKIKKWTGQAWDWVWGKVKSIAGAILGFFQRWNLVSVFLRHWDSIRTGVSAKANSLLSFVRSIPGRVKSALGSLGGLLLGAGRSIVQGLINGVTGMIGSLRNRFSSITSMIPDWKGPMTLDMKLLTPSGQALMSGLMGGIDKQVPALQGQLRGITSGIVKGIGAPALDRTMAGLTAPSLGPTGMTTAGGGASGRSGRTVLELRSSGSKVDQLLLEILKSAIRGRGGDVEVVLGQR
ncbi:hypothetical protein [Streptomyces sp. NPDC058280]|uniref:hypothetical protein n=1 Tax=Streptomyces sp. NPDC058280 TaxID=3346419 RepID=UPI0036EB2344